MTPETIFRIHLIFGYLVWLLFFGAYAMPKLRSMGWVDAQRAIATLHSFRFFGLVFILPGVVGTLPGTFARFAAYGDFVTAVLAIIALLTVRIPSLFRVFVIAFNVAGAADILIDYYHATVEGLPFVVGQLGASYWIPVLYVPVLMITHGIAFYLPLRPQRATGRIFAGQTATS
ncbi:MAG TPA: hypothetical protein VN734_00100 [Acidobacteriaceae bacterium]|nr:hypothetical protein [Acidobacteriaceae bacterium]